MYKTCTSQEIHNVLTTKCLHNSVALNIITNLQVNISDGMFFAHLHCLSPSAHVADVVSRGHRRAALILRAFTSQDVRLLLRAFIVYVRPVLEYNTVMWSPHTVQI